ncbi:MAG: hypothetical protein H0T78_10330 [Longispora sp.]|nr:hypothetical protein [Longispora sp. (in: high G+C Gram-positive bacteria)]
MGETTTTTTFGETQQSYGDAGGQTSQITVEQGKEAARTAVEQGKQTAQTAVEQGKEVVAEVSRQARDLAGRARDELGEQAASQQQRIAGGLRSLGDELRSMVESGGQSGMGSQLGMEVSRKATGVAEWLEQRQPGELLDEVRQYARHHPGVFLFGSTLAGIVVGRLTRGMVSAAREENGSSESDITSMTSTRVTTSESLTPPLSQYQQPQYQDPAYREPTAGDQPLSDFVEPDSPLGGMRR